MSYSTIAPHGKAGKGIYLRNPLPCVIKLAFTSKIGDFESKILSSRVKVAKQTYLFSNSPFDHFMGELQEKFQNHIESRKDALYTEYKHLEWELFYWDSKNECNIQIENDKDLRDSYNELKASNESATKKFHFLLLGSEMDDDDDESNESNESNDSNESNASNDASSKKGNGDNGDVMSGNSDNNDESETENKEKEGEKEKEKVKDNDNDNDHNSNAWSDTNSRHEGESPYCSSICGKRGMDDSFEDRDPKKRRIDELDALIPIDLRKTYIQSIFHHSKCYKCMICGTHYDSAEMVVKHVRDKLELLQRYNIGSSLNGDKKGECLSCRLTVSTEENAMANHHIHHLKENLARAQAMQALVKQNEELKQSRRESRAQNTINVINKPINQQTNNEK